MDERTKNELTDAFVHALSREATWSEPASPQSDDSMVRLLATVNPTGTMRMHVSVYDVAALDDDPEGLDTTQITVALFDNSRHIFDAGFGLSAWRSAAQLAHDLLTESVYVEVYREDGAWAGSATVHKGQPNEERLSNFGYARSWLGTYDAEELL